MNIDDIENFNIGDAVKFHRSLNPKLFDDDHLIPEVRKQLLEIARDFVDFMGIDDLKVADVRIYGSNVGFNYTPHSDIDLHVLVDMDGVGDDEVYRELFNAKKTLYNLKHPITVRGYDVELYAQDKNESVKSGGEYSVSSRKWIKYPGRKSATFELAEVRSKFKKLVAASELALRGRDLELLDQLLDTIRKYRQAGLASGGEFSPENLAYKALRSRGIVERLYKHRDRLRARDLSIDEDYDAEHPPGPEFKPTMPAGTVRVDVSDVYDWYKLGQHISDLDGLGKHDFGKGPPSTIMAFGDEDLEHKYIQNLKKTGLDTTDIDPAAHGKIPGQKVDPTYNVSESHDKKWNSPGTLYYRKKPFGVDDWLIKPRGERDWEQKKINLSNHGEAVSLWYKMATGWRGEFDSKLYNVNGMPEEYYPYFITTVDGIPQKLPIYQVPTKSKKQKKISGPDPLVVLPKTRSSYTDQQLKKMGATNDSQDGLWRVPKSKIKNFYEASGYIPSDSERDDPRWKTALTRDIGPNAIKDNASKLGLGKIHRSGRPQLARTNGTMKKR